MMLTVLNILEIEYFFFSFIKDSFDEHAGSVTTLLHNMSMIHFNIIFTYTLSSTKTILTYSTLLKALYLTVSYGKKTDE